MSSRIARLVHSYQSYIELPWEKGLAGVQKVIFAVYDKTEELRMRSQIEEFEIATKAAKHEWLLIDITDAFPQWMAQQEYREAYFEYPDDLQDKLGEFTESVVSQINDQLSEADENTVVALQGVERLVAAENLKQRLELILEGEDPYDIFVRWKPLEEQPIGWNPDLNDGVRLNIRPFMSVADVGKKGAGILRAKPNIHWKKDRGKDVESAPWYKLGLEYGGKEGDRINDHHLALAEKQASRDKPTESS